MFLHQFSLKSIVAGRNRCVCGEAGHACGLIMSLGKAESIVVHEVIDRLQRSESRMSFVEMVNTRIDPQCV